MKTVFLTAIIYMVIYYNPAGTVVNIKEKYGSNFIDTVTQIEWKDGQYVTYGKLDEVKGWYPKENHSITIVKELK